MKIMNPVEDADVDVVDSEAPVVNARKIVGYLYKALNGASEGSHLIKPENQHYMNSLWNQPGL